MYANVWQIDSTKILLRHELAAILTDLQQKSRRSASTRLNRTIFRLACCCGLRVSEIAGLQLGDLQLAGPRPHLRIRAHVAKGGRGRRVPCWWDAGTLADLNAWYAERVAQGAKRKRYVRLWTTGARCGRHQQCTFRLALLSR